MSTVNYPRLFEVSTSIYKLLTQLSYTNTIVTIYYKDNYKVYCLYEYVRNL